MAHTVNLAESLSLPIADSDVAFMANPIHMIGVIYCKYVKAIHTAVAIIDTGAGANVSRSAIIPPGWADRVKNGAIPRFLTVSNSRFKLKNFSFYTYYSETYVHEFDLEMKHISRSIYYSIQHLSNPSFANFSF